MRIAYLGFAPQIDAESGVLKKMADQLRAWTAAGHEAKLFALSRDSQSIWPGLASFPLDVEGGARPMNFWQPAGRLVKRLLAWRPDVTYFRYGPYFPAIERLAAQIPLVIEINSNDSAERRAASLGSLSATLKHGYNACLRGRLLRRAAAFVCVTGELAAQFAPRGRPKLVLGNGIDLSRVGQMPPAENDLPRLVYVGSAVAPWNGADLLVEFARHRPEWSFELIGIAPGELPSAAPANCRFHGSLGQAEYEQILARSDVAVGTLALHRKGMREASPLKVREYLACGLPAIIAYDDTDFPTGTPFLLRLPAGGNPLLEHASRVREFVATWQGRRVPSNEIQHLDVASKEHRRLEFLRCVQADWHRNLRLAG